MKKKHVRKMTLCRETLHCLEAADLQKAQGGDSPTETFCGSRCNPECNSQLT